MPTLGGGAAHRGRTRLRRSNEGFGGQAWAMTANVKISTTSRYGPLQEGFGFDLTEGYKVLVGRNNSGKSAILQLAFRALMSDQAHGPERVCLLPTVRDYV